MWLTMGVDPQAFRVSSAGVGFPQKEGTFQVGWAGEGWVGVWRQGFRIREVPLFGHGFSQGQWCSPGVCSVCGVSRTCAAV